jgi:hypothetical protein
MYGGIHSNWLFFVLAFVCTNPAHACKPFRGAGKCDKINACEFVCVEHRNSLLNTLSTYKDLPCNDENVMYATGVVTRDEEDKHDCANDIKQLLSNYNNCPTIPVISKVETCNNKMWYTREQTIIMTLLTAYIVGINVLNVLLHE